MLEKNLQKKTQVIDYLNLMHHWYINTKHYHYHFWEHLGRISMPLFCKQKLSKNTTLRQMALTHQHMPKHSKFLYIWKLQYLQIPNIQKIFT